MSFKFCLGFLNLIGTGNTRLRTCQNNLNKSTVERVCLLSETHNKKVFRC